MPSEIFFENLQAAFASPRHVLFLLVLAIPAGCLVIAWIAQEKASKRKTPQDGKIPDGKDIDSKNTERKGCLPSTGQEKGRS
jgi:hypothetical protein